MMERTNKGFSVQFASLTDVGNKRDDNQDNYYCGTLWDDKHILTMVVDGVGGYAGGDVAARIAVEETVGYLEKYRDGERSRLMAEAFVQANNSIFRQRNSEDRLYRMCCVMTAALFDLEQGCIYMAHVGDTRLYAFSGGRIIKLSHDHSPVGRDEEQGYLSELEAMQNPFRNIIDRVVGENPLDNATDFIETNVFSMGEGITWMFCSDGLSDLITSAQMSLILSGEESLEEKAQELVDAANAAGGKDNITVVLVQTGNTPDDRTGQVMDDYALNVLPPRPIEEEPEDTCLSEEPDTSESVTDNVVVSEFEEKQETIEIQKTETQQRPSDTSVTEPLAHVVPHRSFPWTPFILFVTTILLAFVIVWSYKNLRTIEEQEHNVPSLQEQQQQRERLYYNINNQNPL